jgi:desampylase
VVVWLSEAVAREMVRHARDGAPEEVCGLLAGQAGKVERVIPVENVAADRRHHYEMSAVALSRHLPALEREGLELVGFYHSHPNSDPIPSASDVAQATYPRTPYIIVGLRQHEARLAAWLMDKGQVERVHLHIGLNPPEVIDQDVSPAQRFAILWAALLAFFILLVLSLILLPPAPIIPR